LNKIKLLPIAGDASFRNFYRLISNKRSKIIVYSKKDNYKNLIAYSAVNKFLKKNKILTPMLYNHNFSKGLIVIEDFGNMSFYKILLKNKKRFFIYKKLVDTLIKIQKIKPKSKIKINGQQFHKINKYSKKYLHRESDLFFDWYLPFFFKGKKVENIKKKSKKILSKLYNKLNFPNSFFVHRDYHVQNLMSFKKKIGLIDSQDALIGNPAYDLASLIDDVRIKNSKETKEQIYNYYLKKKPNFNKKKFLEDFNILSVQRNLKIIGIFSRLYKRDNKKQYLKLIPYAWKTVEMRMESKLFSELKKIIDNNISKKKRNFLIK
jgi:N-acetylmuramate 1-kinase